MLCVFAPLCAFASKKPPNPSIPPYFFGSLFAS